MCRCACVYCDRHRCHDVLRVLCVRVTECDFVREWAADGPVLCNVRATSEPLCTAPLDTGDSRARATPLACLAAHHTQ